MTNENDNDLTPEIEAQLTNLAQNPHDGKPFTFGGKSFTLQFLTIDSQAALTELCMALMANAKENTLAGALAASRDVLKQAFTIVVQDQDPACDFNWVSAVKGPDVSLNKMIEIVVGVMLLNQMGELLGKILALGAIVGAFAVKK